jgi:hypothetical protein
MNDGFNPESPSAAFSLAARLIRYAARSAPPALAERLEEEWLADLAAQPSSFAALSFALGCCWATRVIAREHGTAALSASGSKTVTLDSLRSRSMSRFKSLWIALAALAVTALVICAVLLVPLAVRALATHVLPFLPYKAYWQPIFGVAVPFSVTVGLLAWSWQQMRVRRIPDHAPKLPKPAIVVITLGLVATSGAMFALSAQLASLAVHIADPGKRFALWGGVLYLAVNGAGFLAFLSAFLSRMKRAGVR